MTKYIDAEELTKSIVAMSLDEAIIKGIDNVNNAKYKWILSIIAKQPIIKDAEPHWIPVSEGLPEEPFGCLVTVEDEEPMTGALFPNLLPYFVGWDGEQWNDADGEQCPFEVLAWMPLPEPYEVNYE